MSWWGALLPSICSFALTRNCYSQKTFLFLWLSDTLTLGLSERNACMHASSPAHYQVCMLLPFEIQISHHCSLVKTPSLSLLLLKSHLLFSQSFLFLNGIHLIVCLRTKLIRMCSQNLKMRALPVRSFHLRMQYGFVWLLMSSIRVAQSFLAQYQCNQIVGHSMYVQMLHAKGEMVTWKEKRFISHILKVF